MDKIYWTTKDGGKINVDEMSIEHLRNTLKMIIKQNQKKNVAPFSDSEIKALTNKSQYQFENEENLWK